MFDRLRIPKASDLVIEKIKEEITGGRLKKGMRLPAERDLAAALGVSQPVVREALRMLRFMGIVEMKPGTGGALVLDGNVDALTESLTLVLDLRELSREEVLTVRRALQPVAAELAATKHAPEHVQEMEELVEGMRSGRFPGSDFGAAVANFHVVLAAASGSLLLSAIMKAISRLIYRHAETRLQPDEARQLATRLCAGVYEAVADGDAQLARARMEEYLAVLSA